MEKRPHAHSHHAIRRPEISNGRLREETTAALARLTAAEALLRESRDLLDRDSSSNWINVAWSPVVRRIDAFLAEKQNE